MAYKSVWLDLTKSVEWIANIESKSIEAARAELIHALQDGSITAKADWTTRTGFRVSKPVLATQWRDPISVSYSFEESPELYFLAVNDLEHWWGPKATERPPSILPSMAHMEAEAATKRLENAQRAPHRPIQVMRPKVEEVPTRTGVAGRPTSRHLLIAELKRRASAGELASTLAQQVRDLGDWLKKSHPDAPQPMSKALAENIRTDYRRLTKPRKPAKSMVP